MKVKLDVASIRCQKPKISEYKIKNRDCRTSKSESYSIENTNLIRWESKLNQSTYRSKRKREREYVWVSWRDSNSRQCRHQRRRDQLQWRSSELDETAIHPWLLLLLLLLRSDSVHHRLRAGDQIAHPSTIPCAESHRQSVGWLVGWLAGFVGFGLSRSSQLVGVKVSLSHFLLANPPTLCELNSMNLDSRPTRMIQNYIRNS